MPIDEVVEDGDRIDVFVARRLGNIHIEVENLTQGWRATKIVDGFRSVNASVLYRPISLDGVALPVLDPGGAAVKGVLIDGRLQQHDPKKLVLVNDTGDPLVRPTKIRNEVDFRFRTVG